MDELQTHDLMASALLSRGIVTAQDIAEDRAALVARLDGTAETTAPWQPPQPTGSATGKPGAAKPLGSTASTMGTDEPSEEQAQQVDPVTAAAEAAFQGADSPRAFNFGQVPYGVKHSIEQETAFREMFHAAEVPAFLGNEVGRLWNKACASPLPTETQLELAARSAHVALSKVWGADMAENLQMANDELKRIASANPAVPVVQMMQRSGLASNPWLVTALADLAQARKGRV